MALLISSLILANGAAVSVVIMQLIDLNRSVGRLEGSVGSLPEDKKTVITRLERLEYGQNDLLRQLGILTAALGDSPKELIIAAEKVKDNFAAFDQLRDDVFQTKLIAQDFASQMGELQDTLEGLNQAMYDKEGGLTTKISAMDGQMSEMLRDLQAIKGKLGIGTP